MAILLLDRSLKVDIFFDESDREFDDNICVSFVEDCPPEEKVFNADETNLYLTCSEAGQLIEALQTAIQSSRCSSASNNP